MPLSLFCVGQGLLGIPSRCLCFSLCEWLSTGDSLWVRDGACLYFPSHPWDPHQGQTCAGPVHAAVDSELICASVLLSLESPVSLVSLIPSDSYIIAFLPWALRGGIWWRHSLRLGLNIQVSTTHPLPRLCTLFSCRSLVSPSPSGGSSSVAVSQTLVYPYTQNVVRSHSVAVFP